LKLEGGYYVFGSKKIYLKILLNELVAKVNTSFVPFAEFMVQFYDKEADAIIREMEDDESPEDVVRRYHQRFMEQIE
jgi:hypothetical protein